MIIVLPQWHRRRFEQHECPVLSPWAPKQSRDRLPRRVRFVGSHCFGVPNQVSSDTTLRGSDPVETSRLTGNTYDPSIYVSGAGNDVTPVSDKKRDGTGPAYSIHNGIQSALHLGGF